MTTTASRVEQPSYDQTLGRFVRRGTITLKTSAVESSSNTTDDGIRVDAAQLSLNANLTASSSPTTLILTIQGSPDGTVWYDLGVMKTSGGVGQLGAVATGDLYYEGAGAKYVRYKSAVTGTSYTYSITGTYRY